MKKIKVDKGSLNELRAKYARVNKKVRVKAFRELFHNCYDADASWVKISFDEDSVLIEDNGVGVPQEMMENWFVLGKTMKSMEGRKWNKITASVSDDEMKNLMTESGRIYRGGYGKGRLASLFQIGKCFKITTKSKNDDNIYVLSYEASADEATLVTEPAPAGCRNGTAIKITDLNGTWNKFQLIQLYHDFVRLYYKLSLSPKSSCEVLFYKDNRCKFSIDYKYRQGYAVHLFMWVKASLLVFNMVGL